MRPGITRRFELNLSPNALAAEADDISAFAAKNRCPAIVVPPSLVMPTQIQRTQFNAGYKIIATIGFGSKDYALDKFKELDQSVFTVDGYDILLTAGRTDIETKKEAEIFREFIQDRVNPHAEIRFTLNMHIRPEEEMDVFYKAMRKVRPAFIRTDENLAMPPLRCNPETQARHVDAIRATGLADPIKLSGNIDAATIINLHHKVERFDVTLTQAHEILKTFEEQNIQLSQEKVEHDVFFTVEYGEKELQVPIQLVEFYKHQGYSEENALQKACEDMEAKMEAQNV